MSYEKLAKRARQLADIMFKENAVDITFQETDKYYDGNVTFNGDVSIAEYDVDVNSLRDEKITAKEYQVYISTYIPGRNYRDGSGEPPDVDVMDFESPHRKFDNAVCAALGLVLQRSLEDFLVSEDEDKLAKELEEEENGREEVLSRLEHS